MFRLGRTVEPDPDVGHGLERGVGGVVRAAPVGAEGGEGEAELLAGKAGGFFEDGLLVGGGSDLEFAGVPRRTFQVVSMQPELDPTARLEILDPLEVGRIVRSREAQMMPKEPLMRFSTR